MSRIHQTGQLLLPMLAVLFLFGIFWVGYVCWCRNIYWQMRMDMAADATALSAARQEAASLNTIGTLQYFENLFIQKVRIGGEDVGGIQTTAVSAFNGYNDVLNLTVDQWYAKSAYEVGRTVATANGATLPPAPIPFPQHHLKPQAVDVNFFYGIYRTGGRRYSAAYFARDWWPRKTAPQPIHRYTWTVCHGTICGKGKARLWLDVEPGDLLNNGGFPSEQPSLLRGIGIQCNYPQFNARLMPKTGI